MSVGTEGGREALVLIPWLGTLPNPSPCPTSTSLLVSGVSVACSKLTVRHALDAEHSFAKPSARGRTFLEECSLSFAWPSPIRWGPTSAEGFTAGAGNWNRILELTGDRAELLFRGLRLTAIPLNRSSAYILLLQYTNK